MRYHILYWEAGAAGVFFIILNLARSALKRALGAWFACSKEIRSAILV